MASSHRVLFVDAFDSFSNNIISLLETRCAVETIKLTISTDVEHLEPAIRSVQAVIIGPGPGIASEAIDTGNIDAVWSLCERYSVPVLGICLGFQTLVLRYGGSSGRLANPRHGFRTRITGCSDSVLFSELDQIFSVQYHSNFVSIGHAVEKTGGDLAFDDSQLAWQPSPHCPDLVPLAWDFDRQVEMEAYHGTTSYMCDGNHNPPAILMSVRHRNLPFFGVQFHPESVRSSEEARRVVVNWWEFVRTHSRDFISGLPNPATPNPFQPHSFTQGDSELVSPTAGIQGQPLLYKQLDSDLDVLSVIKRLGLHPEHGKEFMLLDSERCQRPELGVSSVIGLILPGTPRITYKVGERFVQLSEGDIQNRYPFDGSQASIFSFLKSYMNGRKVQESSGPSLSPFWGGLIGYISYEAGLEVLGVTIQTVHTDAEEAPDVNFAFIERSIVINHSEKKVFVQSTNPNDRDWICKATSLLRDRKPAKQCQGRLNMNGSPNHVLDGVKWKQTVSSHSKAEKRESRTRVSVQQPNRTGYENKIRECLKYIRNGDSYELCLTGKTKISTDNTMPGSEWALYRQLRKSNPAPFGAYMKLDSMTIASSSPERFLSWTRPNSSAGSNASSDVHESFRCQFRPIKGTVKKRHEDCYGQIHLVDRKTAEEILSSAKEEAENLMIADLIRHDLAGVIGSKNVYTKDLMRVEEYETVYQLVTVIEGRVPLTRSNEGEIQQQIGTTSQKPDFGTIHGIDILAASLPPGSMTGAPKKRSCEILRKIEGGHKRSIYSGVLGYLDVGGAGDFSVVIRTAYKYSSSRADGEGGDWHIGAGGAITALSSLKGEWDEMRTKLESVLPVFR